MPAIHLDETDHARLTSLSYAASGHTGFAASVHTHDDRYYTEAEVDALLAGLGGGVTDHDDLNNLSYAASGHTGFAGTGVANTFAGDQTISAGNLVLDSEKGLKADAIRFRTSADVTILRVIAASAWTDNVPTAYFQGGSFGTHDGWVLQTGCQRLALIADRWVQATNNNIGTAAPPGACLESYDQRGNVPGFRVRMPSGATAEAVQLFGVSSTGTDRQQAAVDTAWADSTDATRKARVTHSVYDTDARETFREESDGSRGYMVLKCHATAPGDAMLPNDSIAFYRDGATVKVKAKDGSGTVTTGDVATLS